MVKKQIPIKTERLNDTLFIDFKYQGVPEDIPIETFEIRPSIKRNEEEPENRDDDVIAELREEEIIDESVDNKPIIKQRVPSASYEALPFN